MWKPRQYRINIILKSGKIMHREWVPDRRAVQQRLKDLIDRMPEKDHNAVTFIETEPDGTEWPTGLLAKSEIAGLEIEASR